ncbi:MAG TPA: carboxypeptidase-like regulatory domain-containing protein, partial [Blastocatellia bacterium]|nr:carboxypeptidase-like regulatory domain-containing protein [Blastocatellia bacterium]
MIRHTLQWVLPAVMAVSMCLADCAVAAAQQPHAVTEPDIWLGSYARMDKSPWRAIADAPEMFQPGASWETLARHVKVVKFPPGNIVLATDEALRSAFADLKRRHIALALEVSLLTKTDQCRQKSEAYLDSLQALQNVVDKMHRNGGDLRYIAMDEPFYYGHAHKAPDSCYDSAAAIAQRIAENAKLVRRVFPLVQIGDIEVVTASRPWVDELAEWTDAYRKAMGEPLAFLHVDVAWSQPAMDNLKPLAKVLSERNIPFGIIYNADGNVTSDQEFVQSAIDHFTEIESALGAHPNQAIFQTWVPYPSHMLPEDRPGTLANLALQYLRPRTPIALTREGDAISGRVTDLHGNPVANAKVDLRALDLEARMGLTDRTLTGIVPQGADTAIIGIQANLE